VIYPPRRSRHSAAAFEPPFFGESVVMDLPDLEQLFGVKAVFVKAGSAGAVVAAVVQRVEDWKEALARGIAGIGCAAYLTPFVARKMNVEQLDDLGALAFVMGMGGMWLAAAIIKACKDPWGTWDRFRGRNTGGAP
jgi:hypothetical protein